MKINNINSQLGKLLGKSNKAELENTKPVEKDKPNVAVSSDRVSISPQAKRLEELVAAAMENKDDQARVQELKEKISKGEYQLDSKELAARMLSREEDQEGLV